METHDIHNLTTYNTYQAYYNKNPSIKTATTAGKDIAISEIQKEQPFNNIGTRDSQAQHIKLPIHDILPLLETEITMAVEKDLNIVVTTVKNKDTDKVIRQIPDKEIIERLKYFKKYTKYLISQEEKDQAANNTKNF
ncbi:MAG: hypothetical protein AYP45_12030 [Candidatus Brocadia carolinensis]|uniref:Flagellar protein FlaG n=1 Tax=Candidatus Brocadia carolinensis TaxID=1004156 RepID=A0A1V4ARZ8_9BACT|nr:MAG: hypothetical protein AYP45_12030 [Candidatus Brocadia caroliniensis]